MRIGSLGIGALAALGVACGGNAGVPAGTPDGQGCYWQLNASGPTPGVTQTGATSADLTGMPIGGPPFKPTFRKKIDVTVTNKPADLQLGDGYLVKHPAYGGNAAFFQAATNMGAAPICAVMLTSVAWSTAAGGTPALSYGLVRLLGSVGISTSGTRTTCLFPGEMGFLQADLLAEPGKPFDEIASLSFTFGMDGVVSSGTAPTERLVPDGYDVGTCGMVNVVRVHLTNLGDDTVMISPTRLSTMVLLSEDGLPVGTIPLKAPIGSVPPHASTTYAPPYMESYGGSKRVIVFANFAASN